jgi:hypothetical protein
MLERFLQRFPTDCTKNFLQKMDFLLLVKLKLLDLNYQTPFYADCILKYREKCHKNYFWVDNSCNFKAISKSDISKQIYKVG